MDILGQSALILAVSAFALAITALSRNLRNKLVMTYGLLCGTISLWALFFFLEKIWGGGAFYRYHLYFNFWLAPAGILFLRVLTRADTRVVRYLGRASMLYATAGSLALWWFEWGAISDRPIARAATLFAPTFLVAACVHLMGVDLRRRRRIWIYGGALALLGMAVMDHVPVLGSGVPSVGNILLCLYLFVVSEAVIHQRLLNLSALRNRVVALASVSAVFTGIYAVLVAWVENSPGLFVLNSALASFIILMLIEPVKKLASMAVARLFSGKYLKFERMVAEAETKLLGVLDTAGLAQLALQFLESALRCESATFFVLRSDGAKLRRIRGLRDDALLNREILVNHPVAGFFGRIRRRGETPVILDHYLANEIDRTTSRSQRQAYELVLKGLAGLNANIAIPLLDEGTLLGFVAVRAPEPPEPWENNWGVLTAIYPFFTQAARTLKNMDVYVRLREKDRLAALGEMAAGLAHEIRNPLGAIKGAAQYLDPSGSGPHAAFLGVIVEETNRLNKVVSQFLDYSRPLSADMVPYNVGAILERTHALFQTEGAGAWASLKIELVPPPGGFSSLPAVPCAPEQIKQVLVNLVRNSIQSVAEAGPREGGLIRIGATSRRGSEDGVSEVVAWVEDNGKGISRDHMDKIFIPFFTTSPGGTGLGLPICSRIVEAHGGRIDVLSEEGKFTRFSVHLPVSEKREGEIAV